MFKMNLKNIVFLTTIFISSNVFALEFQGKFIQGHFILGKTHPDSKIWVDKRKVKITEDEYYDLILALIHASDLYKESSEIKFKKKSREFLRLKDKLKRC